MLVSIALTAATVCTASACIKGLDETQWPETRDETYWAETETVLLREETLSVRLETETFRTRPHPWYLLDPGFTNWTTGRHAL